MERVTRKQLQRKVDIINRMMGTPTTAYHKRPDNGGIVHHPGHFMLDHYQPGGNSHTWRLEYMSRNGGSNTVTNLRYTASEMAAQLEGIIWALEHAQERGMYASHVEGARPVETLMTDAKNGN